MRGGGTLRIRLESGQRPPHQTGLPVTRDLESLVKISIMPARLLNGGPARAPTGRDRPALASRTACGWAFMPGSPFPPPPSPRGPVQLHTDHHPFGIVWLHSTLPPRIDRWGARVLVSALTIGPARGDVPFVSTVHDLTPLTHPEWHASRTVIGFVPLWDRTVERASRFLCVSQTTANDLVARYPETAARVRVAENGVDRAFFSPADDPAARLRTRQRYADGRPFLLYLGTLEPRKNVEALVVACERLWGRRRSRPDLVLAGGAGWKTAGLHRRIARSPFRDKIHVAGYAARDAARELYRAAEAFVYPSLAEGFGLPVLDAMSAAFRWWPRRPKRWSRSAGTPPCTPRPATSRPCPSRSSGS